MSVTSKPITQNCTAVIRLGLLSAVAGQDHSGATFFARNSVGIHCTSLKNLRKVTAVTEFLAGSGNVNSQ